MKKKCYDRAKIMLFISQEMVEALKALSIFFADNSLRSRRNLRGDIEKRSLAINESFESAFREVKQVSKWNGITLWGGLYKHIFPDLLFVAPVMGLLESPSAGFEEVHTYS